MFMTRPFPLAMLAFIAAPSLSFSVDYQVPVNDVAGFFARLPDDATYVHFSAAAVYRCEGDIILPERQLLVIDGRGAKLMLGNGSHGFTMRVADQKEAERKTASRYVIRDFASINGGRKAVDLKASLGSVITNCRMVGQSEVAIDLRFCLMTRLENIMVTNPTKRGFVLRQGDWPGATGINSQSNSSVLEQCRVYNSKTSTAAFTILNSGGVRMTDCISEGHTAEYDIFLSASLSGNEDITATSPVVKSFTLSNFHVEHKTTKTSIYVNMPSKATVNISNVYWNIPLIAPAITYAGGQLNLSEIGWWPRGAIIASRVEAPRINIDRCHSLLFIDPKKRDSQTKFGALELRDPIPGNATLKANYVRIRQRAM
jgi:hypothetical protein